MKVAKIKEDSTAVIEIRTLDALLKHLDEHCKSRDEYLFRGQSEDWPLLPKLGRVVPRYEDRKKAERKMFDEFKRQAIAFIDEKPSTDLEWLTIAQHHGMATRLLDWSSNPLSALWFAVKAPPKSEQGGVLWMFEPADSDYTDENKLKNVFENGKTSVFKPKHIVRRIAAQHGWFTVHGLGSDGSKFVPLLSNARLKDKLTKFIIPSESFSVLRSSLDRAGVNSVTLFPDLDGLAKDVEWKATRLPDE